MKILVVDDIGYSRHNLAMTLEQLGHETVQAESGSAGLSILRKDQTIDAVITDLIMDGLDGVEFFIRAKQLQRIDDEGTAIFPTFILLTSAQPGRPGATKSVLKQLKLATEIGFAKILYKPINPKVIKEALAELQMVKTVAAVEIVPLIVHLENVTQQLADGNNVEDVEKLKDALKEQLQLLEQIAVPVES